MRYKHEKLDKALLDLYDLAQSMTYKRAHYEKERIIKEELIKRGYGEYKNELCYFVLSCSKDQINKLRIRYYGCASIF